MNTYYYSIKDGNRIGEQPVSKIMKTVDYTYFSPGMYEHDTTHDRIKLNHIADWEYDMLDAFGVTIVASAWFIRMDWVYI
jgi:hypothetical protein